jgi:hypothetical protein
MVRDRVEPRGQLVAPVVAVTLRDHRQKHVAGNVLRIRPVAEQPETEMQDATLLALEQLPECPLMPCLIVHHDLFV